MLVTLIAAGRPGFGRDKNETIEAQAFGTPTQLGQNIGVTLNIYEFSTPADKQVLVQAYTQGQNKGLVNALKKMRAVGHVEITGTLGYDCSYIRVFPDAHGPQDSFCHQSPDQYGRGLDGQQFYVLRSDCGGSGTERSG